MANTTHNILYAIKNGEIVHISDVERGLKCGCICPACGANLVARKGKIKAHHFAHHSNESCEYGYESSLHLAAKDILSRSKKMILPPIWVKFDYKEKICLREAQEIPITRVELEKKFSDVIPDVVVYSGNRRIFVEIYVTHAIDDIKLKKLQKANASTIEIDLSKYTEDITRENLTDILLNNSPDKVWKYNLEAEQCFQRFYAVSEVKETTARGFALHVDNCPIAVRSWKGKPYANYIDDCLGCKYNIKNNKDGTLLCTGKQRIATLEDFDIPAERRIQDSQKQDEQERLENVFRGICPNCGGHLREIHGSNGIFGGCSNYPHCRFTVSVDMDTGELIMKA